jgi:hypothetical protein
MTAAFWGQSASVADGRTCSALVFVPVQYLLAFALLGADERHMRHSTMLACSRPCLDEFKQQHDDFLGTEDAADTWRAIQAQAECPAAPHSVLPSLEPYVSQVRTVYEPCTNYVRTLYELYTNRVQTMYELYTNRVRTIYVPCTNYV